MTIPQALELALQHHRAGRLADAETLYRQILAVQPNHADALHFLGVVAHQAGRHDLAVEWIRQSIVFSPDNFAAYSNLGEAYRVTGRLEEAMAAFRRALELRPHDPEAHYNLGNALKDQSQLDKAIVAYRRTLELRPGYPEAHNNLGIALMRRGEFGEAISAFRSASELRPGYAEAQNNLGNALRELGEHNESIASYRRALHVKPDYPEAYNNLGNALRDQGQLDEAIAAYRRALQIKVGYLEAHYNLGVALRLQGRLDEAMISYRDALRLDPNFAEAHNNLGNVLRDQGRLDEAMSAYRNALRLKPNYADASNNLGNALRDQGQLDGAIEEYRRALKFKPELASIHSNLIFTLHYCPVYDARAISEEHECWNRQFSEPSKPFILPHCNDRNPERRLRVGYVSPDFLDHVVSRFALPLLKSHDREQFEILCYSGVVRPDSTTERFRMLASAWRNTVGVSDAQLAEMIRKDRVDILVDLAMHTAGNRLTMFARRPAPVQVSWLAYPGSTGLQGISYRLTDAHMDPKGERPPWSSEEPVRLPDCWCCYEPPSESLDINTLPAFSGECVTFGSLNNFAKVNDRVLTLWARVLVALEQSRLLMLCPKGRTRERILAFFGARGIVAERVEFASFLGRREYLKLYQRIDLGLDPFPINGMSTTCDALWMGVPVLTLPGDLPVSRAGLSLLSCVGLGEFAASSEDDYVRIAIELAGDLPRLAELRATLRARMQASPLTDAPRFAKNVGAAYRFMWRAWCASASRSPGREEALPVAQSQ